MRKAEEQVPASAIVNAIRSCVLYLRALQRVRLSCTRTLYATFSTRLPTGRTARLASRLPSFFFCPRLTTPGGCRDKNAEAASVHPASLDTREPLASSCQTDWLSGSTWTALSATCSIAYNAQDKHVVHGDSSSPAATGEDAAARWQRQPASSVSAKREQLQIFTEKQP